MSNLSVNEINNQLVIDSRLIAEELGIQHPHLRRTIEKYLAELQGFGVLRFENTKLEIGSTGRPERYCYLNEDQATFLMTLSRNTPQVVACKQHLVSAFSEAKKVIKEVIPAQNAEIATLQLQNELLSKQLELRHLDNAMLTLHGAPTVLALRGCQDQVVEVEKPTTEVIDERCNVQYKGQTCTQIKDYLVKHYGIKFKSGAQIHRILEKAEKEKRISLTSKIPRVVYQDFVPEELLKDAIAILRDGNKQLLLGE